MSRSSLFLSGKEGCKNTECLVHHTVILSSFPSARHFFRKPGGRSAACSTQHKRLVKMCEASFALRSARASTHPGSDCAARLPGARSTTAPAPDKPKVYPAAHMLCNPLHLASKVVGQPFPLDSLKTPHRRVMLRHHPPLSAFGKDQNHVAPCFTDRIARSGFAFFAVLSPMPASRSIAKTSR
jgi:hypothetical protein